MLYDLIALILIGSSTWVYWDASGKGIGKQPSKKHFFNLSAGGWGASVLLVWVIALPAYLLKREGLITEAEANPISVKYRGIKAVVLALTGLVLMILIAFEP